MNVQNEERLARLEQVVGSLQTSDPVERRSLLMQPEGTGRSPFQSLLAELVGDRHVDIDPRTESSGASYPIHGEFLAAEPLDDNRRNS